MKRTAQIIAGLSLTALSAAHAAVQVVDTSAYSLSFDNTYFSFSETAGLTVNLLDALNVTDFAEDVLQARNGPLLTVTAKSGYQITGVSQTLVGSAEVVAPATGYLFGRTTWASPSVKFLEANELPEITLGSGSFSHSSVLDVSAAKGKPLTLANVTWVLAIDNYDGGSGSASLTSYKLGFNTVSDVSPVPEPEGVALVLAGLGVMALRRRVARD